MNNIKLIEKVKKFPDTPGVYIMRDSRRQVLYIGKATSLRHRVLSYFQRPQEARIERMISQINNIETLKTDSVIEALLLESNLIKKYQPKYNVKLKDNKTYLGIYITKEEYPRVFPARITQKLPPGEFYGPFPSSKEVGDALQIIRKLFPFRVSCEPNSGKFCFEYHLGMCPGVCGGKIGKEEYQATIKKIRFFMKGQKKEVIRIAQAQMKVAAKNMEFEKAAKLRDQIFALRHIQDVALISDEALQTSPDIPHRIEAYDISNISGAFSVGSMVVFTDGLIDKNEYRKFKIKSVSGADDVASIKEIVSRRMSHEEWVMPDVILVDGGKPQVNAIQGLLSFLKKTIPVVGIAKGPRRDRNDIVSDQAVDIDKKILIRLRDEAHRFAIEYYRNLHRKSLK